MGSKEISRPDPEELLRRIQAQEDEGRKGRLKIFLGYAPRVGKSVRMFDEGFRRKTRGQDVVIGAVQLEGSEHIAQFVRELEVIPTKDDAIDVGAVLARAPHVCLVDELARVNPAGSGNRYRWQDVEELMAGGVGVITALNLQHVAEQQDAIERLTKRRAATAVPQAFIQSADEIVIVDVPTGEVAPDRNNLAPAQLDQLRELALLLAAQVVEDQLTRYMDVHGITQSWGTQERVLVCITPRSSAKTMLESGARTAARFHGQLLAVYVTQTELSRAAEETLNENLALARRLEAEVHLIAGSDAIGAILQFAREHRVTQLFIGHTLQPAWKFWAANPVERLIKAAEGMDVRIFPHAEAGRG